MRKPSAAGLFVIVTVSLGLAAPVFGGWDRVEPDAYTTGETTKNPGEWKRRSGSAAGGG